MFASLTSIIETGLKSMNQSDFQKLSFDFLNFKGFNYISAPGAMVGANKTSPGTPDGFFEDNDGNFVFCEATTLKRENSKKKFLKKLNEDIEHCFNEEKSKISNEDISTVILIFNSKIGPGEVKDLRNKVHEYNSNAKLIIYSIQNLSNFLQGFPNLSNYIQFAPSMEGIYSLTSFVENSSQGIRPDLKNEFIKQEELFEMLIHELNNTDYLCLYGNQGAGKTRLALEIAQEYSKANNYRVIVIKRYSPTLVSDIRKIINPDEKVLFIVDDYTNDFFNLRYVIEDITNLYGDASFKFIFTLRNQFLNLIERELNNYPHKAIQIAPLNDLDMRDFVLEYIHKENISFLSNNFVIDRLVELSKGNIVFCVMAMDLLSKHEDLSILNDSEGIFINYYYNYDNLVDVFYSNDLLKLLGIFSFFDVVDFNDKVALDLIEDAFDCRLIDNSDVDKLVRYELLVKNHDKIYFEDSLLSTYIFYLTFIKREMFDFKRFIEVFIKNAPQRLNYKLKDIFSSFDKEKFEISHFKTLDELENELDDDLLGNFYLIFNSFYSEEILLYVMKHFEEFDCEDYDWDKFTIPDMHNHLPINFHINLLFESDKDRFVLEYAFELIRQKPSLIKDILFHINRKYAFTRYSFGHEEFYLQHLLIDVLTDKHKLGGFNQLIADNIFMFIIDDIKFLEWRHTENGIESIKQPIFFSIHVTYSEGLVELRSKILAYLFNLHETHQSFVEKTLERYIRLINPKFSHIVQMEVNQVYSFLKTMDYAKYRPNKLAFLYKNKLESCEIDCGKDFEFIDNKIIKQIGGCSNALNITETPMEAEIIDDLKECVCEFEPTELLNLMNEIINCEDKVVVYADSLLSILIDTDLKNFMNAFDYYVESCFNLIGRANFIKNLFNSDLSASEVFDLINVDCVEKELYCHSFFLNIPEKEITKDLFYEFENYLNDMKNTNHYFYDLKDYTKYDDVFLELREELDVNGTSNIIQYLTYWLVEKSAEIPVRFNYHFCEEYQDYFEDNFELLKKYYLNHCRIDSNYDNDFKELEILCTIDKTFLKEYLEFKYENDMGWGSEVNLFFVWKLDYGYDDLSSIIIWMIENSDVINDDILIFFSTNHDGQKEFIHKFICENYENRQRMEIIFGVLKEYYSFNEYLEFLELFLKYNHEIEDFIYVVRAKLMLFDWDEDEENLNEDLEFYVSVKKYIEGLYSIEYLEHVVDLKNLIRYIRFELDESN